MNDKVARPVVSREEQAQVIQALRGIASIPTGIVDAAVAIAEGFRQVQASVQEALRQAAPVMEQLNQMRKSIDAWEGTQARATELLAPHGWLLPLRTAMSGSAARIVEIAETDGVMAAEAALMRELAPSACRRMMVDCARHEEFREWRDHLMAALAAHEEGRYLLSVPVWLIVFDGVAHAQLNAVLRDDSIFGQMGEPRREQLLDAFKRDDVWQGYLTAFVTALGAVGRSVRAADIPSPFLNRHVILHGRQPGYGTEKISVQCMVLLEALTVGVS